MEQKKKDWTNRRRKIEQTDEEILNKQRKKEEKLNKPTKKKVKRRDWRNRRKKRKNWMNRLRKKRRTNEREFIETEDWMRPRRESYLCNLCSLKLQGISDVKKKRWREKVGEGWKLWIFLIFGHTLGLSLPVKLMFWNRVQPSPTLEIILKQLFPSLTEQNKQKN